MPCSFSVALEMIYSWYACTYSVKETYFRLEYEKSEFLVSWTLKQVNISTTYKPGVNDYWPAISFQGD